MSLPFNPLTVNPCQSGIINPAPLTNVEMRDVQDKYVPIYDANAAVWRASGALTPLISTGAAGTIYDSDGVTNAFRAPSLSARLTGNLVTTPLDLAASGVSAGTAVFGQQLSIDTFGRTTERQNLDAGGGNFTSLLGAYIGTQSISSGVAAQNLTVSSSTADSNFFQQRPSWWSAGGTITIPITGWYTFKLNARFASTGGTYRQAWLYGNTQNPSTTNLTIDNPATYSTGADTSVLLSNTYRYTAGDTLFFGVSHDRGSSMNVRWFASIIAECNS